MTLVVIFQIAVVFLLAGLVAFGRQPDRFRWAVTVLTFGLVIAFVWISARWEIVSIYYRSLVPILFLAACFMGYRRIRKPPVPASRLQALLGLSLNGAIAVFMGGLIWFSLAGYTTPAGSIDLESPLRDGRHLVLQGGDSPFLNGHARVRPQNYALDIVALDKLGRRKRLLADDGELSAYAIYGANIYSPCDGVVSAAIDEFEDLRPPDRDNENLAGNYVLIACDGVEVLLAHMQQGSITVSAGDRVSTTSFLGRVGNSGNSSEPHLHIHAERGDKPGVILNGKAVPITIGGRFLVRGDRL